MPRLVIVSNRVADPRKLAAGGLAVALGDALNASGGLWFGWSGRILEPGNEAKSSKVRQQTAGSVKLATIDLTQREHDDYYLGYANRVLWPLCHYRLDLADFDPAFRAGYHAVNRRFAEALLPLLRDDDIVWIHDYHLIPLGAELRRLGSRHRLGFFLHIPLPPQLLLAALPGHDALMRSFFAYDLVGLQCESDVVHFDRYARAELQAEVLPDGRYLAAEQTLAVRAFPIGIDVDEFIALGAQREAKAEYAMLRDLYAKRRLMLGIDRLDYSKGLPQRLRAVRDLFVHHPHQRDSATLIQVASPSRESVDAYADLRRELDGLCGEINGDYGELDWMPIRYIHRTVARKRLPGLCRASQVALVTPLRDGMNLVAKEFVAAQDPANPGVLVLSRFAGAAEQMHADALLVNPYDTQGTATTIDRALRMPLEERIERHARLLAGIRAQDVHWWRGQFLDALQALPLEERRAPKARAA